MATCLPKRGRSIHRWRRGTQWTLRSIRLRSPSRRRATSFASASIRSPRMRGRAEAGRSGRAAPVADWSAPIAKRVLCLSAVLQSPEMTRLSEEARWLGQEVGRLRDLDVVANDIVRREAEIHPDEPGLSALADALSRQAEERREHLRKLLAEARVQAFLIDLVRFVETRGWLVPAGF